VADHNCDLRSTAVTEASSKPFQWRITFLPNFTCSVVLHIFLYISLYFAIFHLYFTIFHLYKIFHPPLPVSYSILIFNVQARTFVPYRLLKNIT